MSESTGNLPRLFLDYDRTLFDTDRFAAALLDLLAQETGKTPGSIKESATKAKIDPKFGGFDLDGLVATLGLNSRQVYAELDSLLASDDFLIDGAAQFVQTLLDSGYAPEILTFGQKGIQSAKIEVYLDKLTGDRPRTDLACHITDEPKTDFIRKQAGSAQGILMDDVAGQELPRGFVEINFAQNAKLEAVETNKSGFRVSTYPQALKAIRAVLDQLTAP